MLWNSCVVFAHFTFPSNNLFLHLTHTFMYVEKMFSPIRLVAGLRGISEQLRNFPNGANVMMPCQCVPGWTLRLQTYYILVSNNLFAFKFGVVS